ncbi:MAG: hypothetical protein HZB33_07980 [Nitrospirae bacterium]|nr:hypothetical protein [Nitrospirota bacterium]
MKALRRTLTISCLALLISCGTGWAAPINDRVVAFVDNQAITLSEFEEQYKNTLRVTATVTGEEVLNTMINRILLLREAKKYRIEAPTKEELIKEYINLKIRALLTVSDREIEEFYLANSREFPGLQYDDVRAEIENYLSEKLLNEKLKATIKELRNNAFIKIQLK